MIRATVGPWVHPSEDRWYRMFTWCGVDVIAASVQRNGFYVVFGLPPGRPVVARFQVADAEAAMRAADLVLRTLACYRLPEQVPATEEEVAALLALADRLP